MKWFAAKASTAFGIDWLALGDKLVDPYLIWFDVVGYDLVGEANFEHWYAKKLPLLLELHQPFNGLAEAKLEVPAVYCESLGRGGKTACFVSARVEPCDLAALFENQHIKRFQLELSRIARTDGPPPGKVCPPVAEIPPPSPKSQTWLGVIDIGCAFAHQNLRLSQAGARQSTRVRYLWDQSPSAGPKVAKLGYGTERGPAAFDAAMSRLPDEAACYAALGNDVELGMRAQHGFGVLDLAAARPAPLVAGPPPVEGEPDEAGALSVVFVQLDSFDDRVTNITSLGVHVLDGLRWMIDRVEHDRGGEPDRQVKLVVNISYGGLAGPHDGSSILEKALDELIETRKNLFVVLAAGNSHDPELPTHARLTVKKDQPGTVLWQVEPDDPTDGFLEVWFPKGRSVVEDKVRIRVTAPDGSVSGDIAPNETRLLRRSNAKAAPTAAGAMFRSHAANGEGSAMFLLAVQPTAPGGGGLRAAQAGLWKVEVMCQGDKEMDLHAWLERDDYVAGNLKRQQQSALIDPGDGSVSLEFGLSSLAHGRHSIVAGGYCLSDGGVSEDTASGPSRTPGKRRGPDVSAPSDESRSTPGLLVAGATSGVVNRMSGTSAAAPSVARWIANWCATVPGTVDINMLRDAIGVLPGRDLVRGPPPGPEVVPGTVDDVCRLSRVRINALLEPTLPPPGAVMQVPP